MAGGVSTGTEVGRGTAPAGEARTASRRRSSRRGRPQDPHQEVALRLDRRTVVELEVTAREGSQLGRGSALGELRGGALSQRRAGRAVGGAAGDERRQADDGADPLVARGRRPSRGRSSPSRPTARAAARRGQHAPVRTRARSRGRPPGGARRAIGAARPRSRRSRARRTAAPPRRRPRTPRPVARSSAAGARPPSSAGGRRRDAGRHRPADAARQRSARHRSETRPRSPDRGVLRPCPPNPTPGR